MLIVMQTKIKNKKLGQYKAGVPQGSILSPVFFLLGTAPHAAELHKFSDTTAFFWADVTVTLCSGNNIQIARDRAQRAADFLVQLVQLQDNGGWPESPCAGGLPLVPPRDQLPSMRGGS